MILSLPKNYKAKSILLTSKETLSIQTDKNVI